MLAFGLIGKQLSHSLSADYFNTKFKKLGLDAVYKLFPLDDINDISKLISSEQNLKGLNVTIPYKEKIISFLDRADVLVKETGACNTLCIENGLLHGYNTDVAGFEKSLGELMPQRDTKALVLGTGGAAKAVTFVLKKHGIPYKTVSRYREKGDLIWTDITVELIDDYRLIINATPLGMHPSSGGIPDLPYHALTGRHMAIDLVYNPATTLFIKEFTSRGARALNGLTMLHAQAEEAWKIWQKIL